MSRRFYLGGLGMWVAAAVGHLVLVDALTLHARVFPYAGHADVLEVMQSSTVTMSGFGQATAWGMLTGFSLWVPASISFLALALFLASRVPGVRLAPFARLGLAVSATFTAFAASWFVWAAAAGGGLATLLFGLSLWRNER